MEIAHQKDGNREKVSKRAREKEQERKRESHRQRENVCLPKALFGPAMHIFQGCYKCLEDIWTGSARAGVGWWWRWWRWWEGGGGGGVGDGGVRFERLSRDENNPLPNLWSLCNAGRPLSSQEYACVSLWVCVCVWLGVWGGGVLNTCVYIKYVYLPVDINHLYVAWWILYTCVHVVKYEWERHLFCNSLFWEREREKMTDQAFS